MAGPLWYDRVKFTTATTGTGTITVGSASSGYQTPAGASIATGTTVNYTIEDGTAWEVGYGVYTVSGTTLTRVLISSSTGSLLNLSGSAVCFISATAEYLNGAARIGAPRAAVSAGRYYPPDGNYVASGTFTTTANRLYVAPFSGFINADAMVMEVTSGATGGTGARMGIYACDSGGAPGVLIEEVSAVSMATTGVKVSTFTAARLIGRPVWTAFVVDSATPVVRASQTYSGVQYTQLGSSSTSTASAAGLYKAFTYGTLPSDLTGSTWTESTSATQPGCYLRNV